MGFTIQRQPHATMEAHTHDFISAVREGTSLHGHRGEKKNSQKIRGLIEDNILSFKGKYAVKQLYNKGRRLQKHSSLVCFPIAFKKKLQEWENSSKNSKTDSIHC